MYNVNLVITTRFFLFFKWHKLLILQVKHFKIQPPNKHKQTNKHKIQDWSHRIIVAHFVFKLYPETAVIYAAGMVSIRFFPIPVIQTDLTFIVIFGPMEIYGR